MSRQLTYYTLENPNNIVTIKNGKVIEGKAEDQIAEIINRYSKHSPETIEKRIVNLSMNPYSSQIRIVSANLRGN